MKKILVMILICTICLSLTSCDYKINSIESLMRPPKLSGESSLLQKAFEQSVADSGGVIMKTPISGQNRSSYLFFDLEKDGEQEAIVFYSNPIEDNFASASIFKFVNNEWKNISKIKGKSEEIYEVNFADINGDGTLEILLSWTEISTLDIVNSNDFGTGTNRILTIYSCDGITATPLKTETYTNLLFDDLDNDTAAEIVLFKINLTDNEKRTTARIISFNDDYSVKNDEQLTLTGLLEINNIITDSVIYENENYTRIFIDGLVSEIGIITEIIEINNDTFDISLPLSEQNKSSQSLTLRDSRIYCTDIDNDGYVEIPTVEILPYGARITDENDRKELNLTVWSEFNGIEIINDIKGLLNSTFGYMFVFPDSEINNCTAVYNDNNCTLTFYSLNSNGTYKNELFSLKAFLEPDWDEVNFKYSKLSENGTFVYGYLILDNSNEEYYKEFIDENFVILNRE